MIENNVLLFGGTLREIENCRMFLIPNINEL